MTNKKLGAWVSAFAALAAGLVAVRSGHRSPTPPSVPLVDVACVVQAGGSPVEGATCVLNGQEGVTNNGGYRLFTKIPVGTVVRLDVHAEGFRDYTSAPGDYRIEGNTNLPVTLERSKPPAPPVSRIRIDGRFFVNDSGTFRPVFTSALTLLVRSPEERAKVLDEDVVLGFNGVRVFGGALAWANQTPESAREALPVVLDEAAQRGLYVYVSAITDSGSGYDVAEHLAVVAAICEAHVNCLLEIANEWYHPTQSPRVNDPAWLRQLARRVVPVELPWALGAAAVDEGEGYPGNGGAFVTAHLDRGRDKWNQVRRVREIAGLSEAARVPAMSGEPIGASESAQPGKRENDPAFFFALGALSRLFEVGTVFHSDDGLNARLLGPRQRECATAFVAGFRSISTESRLTFKNATWADSPVAGADFDRGVVRAYSGVAGNDGWLALVGLKGDPALRWGNGWSDRGVVGEMPGIQVRHIGR